MYFIAISNNMEVLSSKFLVPFLSKLATQASFKLDKPNKDRKNTNNGYHLHQSSILTYNGSFSVKGIPIITYGFPLLEMSLPHLTLSPTHLLYPKLSLDDLLPNQISFTKIMPTSFTWEILSWKYHVLYKKKFQESASM